MTCKLHGKGFFIWKIPYCEGGDPQAIAEAAYLAGFSHVLIKVANGPWRYNFDENGNDLVPPVVGALKAKGIDVWGWHYVFGDLPEAVGVNLVLARLDNGKAKHFLLVLVDVLGQFLIDLFDGSVGNSQYDTRIDRLGGRTMLRALDVIGRKVYVCMTINDHGPTPSNDTAIPARTSGPL